MNIEPRFLFVGGSGRSGTSHTAKRLLEHDRIFGFPEIELKLINESGGLIDLHHTLVARYSPNRGKMAIEHFGRVADAVFNGRYGQPPLSRYVSEFDWREILGDFNSSMSTSGHFGPQSAVEFNRKARALLLAIANVAPKTGEIRSGDVFLEKTPHVLLCMDLLQGVLPQSKFLQVIRDPRAVAASLLQMPWGPDNITACCEWVKSYFTTYQWLKERCNLDAQALHEIHIEVVTAAPEISAISVCDWMKIKREPRLFDGSSTSSLNRWRNKCNSEDVAILNSELTETAVDLGYFADRIGVPDSDACTEAAPTISELATADQ